MRGMLRTFILFFALAAWTAESSRAGSTEYPAIVFVFKISSRACDRGLPGYIVHALEQAVMTQHPSTVIMAANFHECPAANATVRAIPGVTLVDTRQIASERTIEFANTSSAVFHSDGAHELWITSALRFTNLEDVMRTFNLKEMFHVEADNLLYGNLTLLLPSFRDDYTALAATPLTANRYFITASLLWVPRFDALVHFNDFMLNISRSSATGTGRAFTDYIEWLRPKACCRWGGPGHPRDVNGTLLEGRSGIKPFMINEMTMLAYYRHRFPPRLLVLPVVPQVPYNLNRWVCNMSEYGPRGREVGAALTVRDAAYVDDERRRRGGLRIVSVATNTVVGSPKMDFLFDPNSYGQYLGGTHKHHDKGYRDITHIVGQAIRTTGCQIRMQCANTTMHAWRNITALGLGRQQPTHTSPRLCYTAPFVFCGTFFPGGWKPPVETPGGGGKAVVSEGTPPPSSEPTPAPTVAGETPDWNALVNLHVHSKNTLEFKSLPCECGRS